MNTATYNYVIEGTMGRLGFHMRWYTLPMTKAEGYFLMLMYDVYQHRMPWKKENGTTARRLQAELDRVILGGTQAGWRWTYVKDTEKQTPHQTYPKASVTYNGPLGSPYTTVGKGGAFSKKVNPRGVAKVLKTKGILVAPTLENSVPTVAEVGFGFGVENVNYDFLYMARHPNKKATEKFRAHIEKEIIACQAHRQRMLITRLTASAKS